MTPISRRNFLKTASGAIAVGAIWKSAPMLHANPLGLPLGLQLYSVRAQIAKDYEGTLQQVAAAGYKEVESAGYFGHRAAEVKAAMGKAGLNCVSAHYSLTDLEAHLDDILVFNKAVGVKYIICSSPAFSPSRVKAGADFKNVAANINLDDWKWNAEQFNRIGEKVKTEGMQFGYHNHTMEFREEKGVVPFEELLRLTDPKNVTIEMDCGWVAVAGRDPAEYLKRYPTRISLLHVKDFKLNGPATVLNPPPSTELGRGTIDYHRIFAAAKKGNIQHYFVEQEEFDMPPFEALKVDAEYIRNLNV
ncbi:MAG: sugar phosphate isomerase/epimerase [Acidobacteriaceae bacterium]|nr:sugar phosphate isomerase/epimerase [Acidobacteriaceae bacterium]